MSVQTILCLASHGQPPANDLIADSGTGTLLFGGYDYSKYTGELTVLPILPSRDDIFRASQVGLTSLYVDGTSVFESNEAPPPALLDSGATMTYLPQDTFDSVIGKFPGAIQGPFGAYVVPCS